jgi:hypothetical protein
MGDVAANRSLAEPGEQATLPDYISQAIRDSSRVDVVGSAHRIDHSARLGDLANGAAVMVISRDAPPVGHRLASRHA